MKIVIPGGSGQVGTVLARHFHATGHHVTVLSRSPKPAPWRVVEWDAHAPGAWGTELEGADVVINLVGRSVNCRYAPANRRAIVESRVRSVQLLADAIAACARPPRVWLQSSTATIYAHRYDAPNDERTGLLGTTPDAPDTWKFSFDVATRWEQALGAAAVPHTRKVAMRAAITLSPDPGGAFGVLLGLVRRGLGGRAGDGRQFVSWVHDHDFVSAVEFLIRREDLSGAVNIAAPNPLPNADFMRVLRDAWGVRFGLPAARWMVELGAWLMRTESELVLKSRRVVPDRLSGAGFTFRFPTWPEAARDLCARWRKASPPPLRLRRRCSAATSSVTILASALALGLHTLPATGGAGRHELRRRSRCEKREGTVKKSNTDGTDAVTVVGVFPDYADARGAIEALRAVGYRDDQIGVFGPDGELSANVEENVGIGATAGGVTGLGLGVAVAAGLMSPFGPVVASGALIALIAGATAGASLGAAVGALVGLGVSEEDARHYASELETGRVVVTVRTANVTTVRNIMNEHGAFNRPSADTAIPGNALPATPY